MHPLPARARARGPVGRPRLRVLLVEDDDADAFLVGELLSEAAAAIDLTVAHSFAAARPHLTSVDCVLLDLGLPDAQGIEGLRRVLEEAQGVAVCVLTGRQDEHLGIHAVAEGAQDYLVKGQVDGALLARSLHYAVERRHAEESTRRLREAELRQAESARLERGLLPQPLMTTDSLAVHMFYRPGRHQALLGGDFYDVVQTSPTCLHAMIGDVSGHDVDEAALGVELRVAWRALTLAGVGEERTLSALEQLLRSERSHPSTFATVATVRIDLDRDLATVRLAGHPPPLIMAKGGASSMAVPYGLLLGVTEVDRPGTEVPLPQGDWSMLLYTDGLVEGKIGAGDERLGMDRLTEMCVDSPARAASLSELPGLLVEQAETANGGALADDVAILLLSKGSGR
jgi:serine phosphatase RsbU (regulator of sigma subunit)